MDQKLLAAAAPYLQLATPVAITDTDRRIVACNDAYCEVTGYARDQLLGQPIRILRSPRAWPGPNESLRLALATSGRWEGYLLNARPDGADWIAHLSVSPIDDGSGRLGFVDIVHDVTAFAQELSGAVPGTPIEPAFVRPHEANIDIFRHLIMSLARMAEVRDPDIQGHLERVQALTRWLLATVDPPSCSQEEREWTALLSILHDVGKVTIPEGILFKPGPLLPEERQLVQLHTTSGEQLLRQFLDIPGFERWRQHAAEIARWHHERWDGTGYPDRLAGAAIPLHARAVGLADVVDALLSQRAYKLPWSWSRVVEYVREQSGRQFDPALVDAFFKVQGLIQKLYESKQAQTT